MYEKLKQSFGKIAVQASNGYIQVNAKHDGSWGFYIKFYTNIEGKNNFDENSSNYPTLTIKNSDSFFKKLNTYLNLAQDFYSSDPAYFDVSKEDARDLYIIFLLANATHYDLANIDAYLDKKLKFLQSQIPEKTFSLGEYNGNEIVAKISKTRSNLEAPYKMELAFKNTENDMFHLPTITFGIADNKAYIYSVQGKNRSQRSEQEKQKDSPFEKKMDRFIRKVNSGISEDQFVFSENKEENEKLINQQTPEDKKFENLILQVSPSAVISLTIFNAFLRNNNINKIVAPCYMPIRHNTLDDKLQRKFSQYEYEKFEKKLNDTHFNITNKLMYLFNRYEYHFPSSEAYFDEYTQEMQVSLRDSAPIDDNIIYDIANSVRKSNNKKEK